MSGERRPSRKPPAPPADERFVVREERVGPVPGRKSHRPPRHSERPEPQPPAQNPPPRGERLAFRDSRRESNFPAAPATAVGRHATAAAEEMVRRPGRTGKTNPPTRAAEEATVGRRRASLPPTQPAPPEADVVIPARPMARSPFSPPRMPGNVGPTAQAPVRAQAPAARPTPAHPFPQAQVPAPAPAPVPAPAPAPVAAAAKPAPVRAAPGTPGQNRIDRFLRLMNDRGASDLHLSVGRPPIFRLSGRMEPIRYRTLDRSDFTQLLEAITPAHLWEEFLETGDVDFAYEVPNVSRFRVNLFRQERGDAAVLRVIPTKLMTVAQLGLPESIRKIVHLRSGLVLVTGPTGSGKSTTLSAIINEMNETRKMHFVTIEDPIEFVHPNKKSLMSQREIGPHSKSFSTALRAAVREDPDAILVGEMRDLETISMALAAAETGVLVFGTLHTNSAAKTIDRVVNVFPADRQPGVRGTLANVLKGVVAQQLLRKKKGGRCAAVEILFGSNAMASMIRDGKTHQISGLIKLGKKDGMVAMDDALKALVEDESIEPLAGLEKSIDKDEFRKWLKERGVSAPEDAH